MPLQPLPPPPQAGSSSAGQEARESTDASRPTLSVQQPAEDQDASRTQSSNKKRRHRGGKKRRNRRQSFAAPPSEVSEVPAIMENIVGDDENGSDSPMRPGESFYKRKNNRSTESLDSDALLDHRNQQPMRPRRESRLNPLAAQRAGQAYRQRSHDNRHHTRRRTGDNDSSDEDPTDRTPLMSVPAHHRSAASPAGYGMFRSETRGSSRSSGGRKRTRSNMGNTGTSHPKYSDSPSYDVNNPPSVPASPHMGAANDPMMPEPSFLTRSPESSRNLKNKLNGDALIDIDPEDALPGESHSAPPSPRLGPEGMTRHKRATTFGPDADVCFPADAMSEMAEEEYEPNGFRDEHSTRRRHRKREWPQLWVLDEWSREEKEDRAADERRMKRINEPVMVGGRLRPSKPSAWHRDEDAAPLRYTYFNEEFESTIHAATISELVPEGGSFRELFIPDPPLLEDSESSDSEDELVSVPVADGTKTQGVTSPKQPQGENANILSRLSTLSTLQQQQPRSQSQEPRLNSIRSEQPNSSHSHSRNPSKARSIDHGELSQVNTITSATPTTKREKPKKYGPRPTFWLDVMSPNDAEMSVLQKAFGIHPLTKEDIMLQEAREKVELFKNYYFINYRTFEQDTESEDYLEPVNVYIVVFRYGILTFHFSQIPHPANVRRRIRQLKDYLLLSADWVGYAMIDDITDAYVPMIHGIETEVDDIDDAILDSTPGAFSVNKEATGDEKLKAENNEKKDDDKSSTFSFKMPFGKSEDKRDTSGYDMLRRVGETRKKVMSLYRLLGTKADVIKGFAKRCNEQWDVAPKSEIGLYLGDIQDHILTMTSNLSHYETLLSRAHSNYLAQVSIRMNERSEQTGDVLNKLTVFGTIVLPMNIICGMWGMNVKVPGQDIDNLWWFTGITGFLLFFAAACYLLCKKLYGIV